MGAFVLVVHILVLSLAVAVYGPRQRAYLRTFLQETLAAT